MMFGRDKAHTDTTDGFDRELSKRFKTCMEHISSLWMDALDTKDRMNDLYARIKNLEKAICEMQNGMIAEVLHRDMKDTMAQHRPVTEVDECRPMLKDDAIHAPDYGEEIDGETVVVDGSLSRYPDSGLTEQWLCPYCACKPLAWKTYDGGRRTWTYTMFCDNGHVLCRGETCDSPADAIRSWNRHVESGVFGGEKKMRLTYQKERTS